jgi:hypothetical protein
MPYITPFALIARYNICPTDYAKFIAFADILCDNFRFLFPRRAAEKIRFFFVKNSSDCNRKSA